jgi:putative toxin-antitoxin system antitoxin component (TIGR02293 family)
MEKRAAAASAKHAARQGAKAVASSTRKRAARARHAPVALKAATPEALYHATGLERVQLIRQGVPASRLEKIVRRMHIPKERLYATLRLPRSTVDRKIRNNETLSAEHSERVIGLERLIGQVEAMVAQSGDPRGFDPSRWIGEWLERPLPALGGAKPADFMDTMQGQELVARLLAQAQSGAYA